MKTYRKPTAIDIFSGCGGLTVGLKKAGFDVLAAIEIEPKARETYLINHPQVSLIGADVRKVTSEEIFRKLKLKAGELDLLAGCPPCQGFSSMRRKNKPQIVFDDRNALIDDFARLAYELRPKAIMMENVPALIGFKKFKSFVINLKNLGYSVICEVLDVADYGVPQHRKRLVLSAAMGGEVELAKPRKQKKTVRNAIGKLADAGCSGDLLHDMPESIRADRVKKIIAAIPKDGGSRHSLPKKLQLSCHKKTNGFNDVYGRMKWDAPSPTITGGCTGPSRGRFLHPELNRVITLREAAVLQGFPKGYTFDINHGKESIALMIGNALPPPFITAHAKKILETLKNEQLDTADDRRNSKRI